MSVLIVGFMAETTLLFACKCVMCG